MHKQAIRTSDAPAPVGPYSQAIASHDFVFLSGQEGFDPATGELVPGGIEAETRQTLANLAAVLAAAGLDASHIVRTEIFLVNMSDFTIVNKLYSEFIADATPDQTEAVMPARQTVTVAALPKGALIEMSAIAHT